MFIQFKTYSTCAFMQSPGFQLYWGTSNRQYKLFLSTSTRKPLKLFPGVSKALENNVYFIPSHLHLYCNMKIWKITWNIKLEEIFSNTYLNMWFNHVLKKKTTEKTWIFLPLLYMNYFQCFWFLSEILEKTFFNNFATIDLCL